MPNLDGTGPRTVGQGLGRGFRKFFKRRGIGGVEECVCPKCGHKMPHKRGIPCTSVECPKCGTPMTGDYCA